MRWSPAVQQSIPAILAAAEIVKGHCLALISGALPATSTAITMAQPDVTSAPSSSAPDLPPSSTLTATASLTLVSIVTGCGLFGDPLTKGSPRKNGEARHEIFQCRETMMGTAKPTSLCIVTERGSSGNPLTIWSR